MESEFIVGFKVLLTAAASDHYNTSYVYDLMGNILSLKRNGLQGDGAYGVVDDLTYTYNGNQVVKVDDAVDGPYYKDAFHFVDGANEDTEYEYDGNGNMTKDLNKKISQIEYNCLNLPQRISYQDGSRVLYTYDAGGVKLRTDYYINPLASSVPQVAGGTGTATTTLKHTWTDYCGNFIYENDSIIQVGFPGGYVSYRDPADSVTDMIDSLTAYTANVPVYHYYVQDHLGNNRIVVDEDDAYGSIIEQINHYYPFGGLMGESRNITSNQKYKYNGKELDRMHGLDWYDYGARSYDGMRFTTMDPLAENIMEVSPYVYCIDNPLRYIDILGLDHVEVSDVDWSDFDTKKDIIDLNEILVTAPQKKCNSINNIGLPQIDNTLSLSNNLSILDYGIHIERSNLIDENHNLWRGENGKWYSINKHPNGITGSFKKIKKTYKTLKMVSKIINFYNLIRSTNSLDNNIKKSNTNGAIIDGVDVGIATLGIIGFSCPYVDAFVIGWTAAEIYDDWSANEDE